MSAVLHVGDRRFSIDDLVALLTSPQVLPQLLRELIVEQAIAEVDCTDEELTQFKDGLAQKTNAQAPPLAAEPLARRQLKLKKFKESCWGSQIDAQFQSHRDRLDRVLFSIIQTQEVEVIQELYFRLQEDEADFSQLATHYSQGPEAQTNGLVGPMEVRNLNPKLAHVLRASRPGQISPPFRVDQWVAIARLERYLPAALDRSTRQRLLDEAFEKWLQEQLQQNSQQVFLERPSQPAKALPASQTAAAGTAVPEAQSEVPPGESAAATPTADRQPAPAPTRQRLAAAPAALRPAVETAERPAVVPQRVAPSELQAELQKRRGSRLPEALMLSLVPIAVGGWSIYALFNFGVTSSPFATSTAPVAEVKTEQGGRVAAPPDTDAGAASPDFHTAVNHANRAADLTQTAQTRTEWQVVAEAWQQAIAGMTAVPEQDARHALARSKVDEYNVYLEYAQEQVNDPDLPFRAAVRRALRASEAGLMARSARDWAQVAQDWAQAADLMRVVQSDSPNYDLARERAQRYQAYRNYAQQQVALDLGR